MRFFGPLVRSPLSLGPTCALLPLNTSRYEVADDAADDGVAAAPLASDAPPSAGGFGTSARRA